ncbi:unnamed protein product [Linum tenue]|uniref:Pentatricopeptide repeat-containing protein n=2 Tax=Linum tenue TaxID=586396 RepID=A0AAV0J951_9ROSI|nr:unnamed protein product [Linum tenue]
METSMALFPSSPSPSLPPKKFEPKVETIKRRLLKKGLEPTPKIIHTLRKKEIQKHNRKLNKIRRTQQPPPLTESEKQALAEESHFLTVKREYRDFTKAVEPRGSGVLLEGRPWEKMGKVKLREISGRCKDFDRGKPKRENLRELKEIFEGNLKWVLDDDIDFEDDDFSRTENETNLEPSRRKCSEGETIQFLVNKLCLKEVTTVKDWKLARMMKQSGLQFTERQLLKIVDTLGARGQWKQALAVVEWEDCNTYPDMAAYHSIAVTLGQAGLLKELMKVMEVMREKPPKRVLNACIPSQQWKGASWVFEQLRKGGLKPNGATYGLAMEVMLRCGKYDLVHEFFNKMNRSGQAPKALTYKVLVRAFWEEGKVNEAVESVRDMEDRGVVGVASVYYELACCLCHHGRWRDAMHEVDKIRRVPQSKPLEYTFTGMILAAMDGGHIHDCIAIFEHMKSHCVPNIGTINTMLRVYCQNDFFSAAKSLYEEIKITYGTHCTPDGYTYSAMLEASANALEWEYFEHVYREMQSILPECISPTETSNYTYILPLTEILLWQGHLLEHAFDTILEAGEIPSPLYFIELVCQAARDQNYEKAVTLANAAAYAPFQISETQWKDILKSYGRKISTDSLHKLLAAISNCHLPSEATVSNLSKALRALCGNETFGYMDPSRQKELL